MGDRGGSAWAVNYHLHYLSLVATLYKIRKVLQVSTVGTVVYGTYTSSRLVLSSLPPSLSLSFSHASLSLRSSMLAEMLYAVVNLPQRDQG